jgi:hypothetical protein
MSQSRKGKRQEPTAEEAAQRIRELRRVYDQGYLSRDKFETMKHDIETRVKPTRSNRAR